MEKVKLEKIIKYTNGLNILTNAGVGIKDIELAYDISVFKSESEKLVKAFQEIAKKEEGTDEKKEAAYAVLLAKEYSIAIPKLTVAALKESEKEIPLLAFDFLHEFMKK